ncbi:keratocan-like [Amphiura filiformis]|uniref:keratocan-like n=1 Tax=Amphiura filiformis TaxID=82378 RepID=UPI003B20D7E6
MAIFANSGVLLPLVFIGIAVTRESPIDMIETYGDYDQVCNVCNCSSFDEYEFINCSYRQLQELPPDVPVNTAELNFEHNNIRAKIDLPSSVLHLYGKDNQLTDIFGMFNETTGITVVDLENNRITSIPKGTFEFCHKLTELYLSANPIHHFNADSFIGLRSLKTLEMKYINGTIIETDLFREIRHSIQDLDINPWPKLTLIEPGAFNFSVRILKFSTGIMDYFPGSIFKQLQGEVQIDKCYIYMSETLNGISGKAFDGVSYMGDLKMIDSSMNYLPEGLLTNTSFVLAVFLQNNRLEDLPVGFLRLSPQLEILSLYNNHLKYITPEILMGLTRLKYLYLFQNLITEIPPLTFYNTNLKTLSIFNNQISTIQKTALRTSRRTLETIYMYYNDLTVIEDNAFDWLANISQV